MTTTLRIYPIKKIQSAAKQKKLQTLQDYNICGRCKIKMTLLANANSLVCSKCSVIGKDVSIGNGCNDISYNTKQTIGGASGRLYKNTLHQHTNDSKITRDHKILTSLINKNYDSKDFKLPKNVLDATAEVFILIKDQCPSFQNRGLRLLGIYGELLIQQCAIHGCNKDKTEIAKFLGIDESHISAGKLELQEKEEQGIIKMRSNVDPTPNMINIYMTDFEMDDKYKPFIFDLINRIEKKRIREITSCEYKTKCVGVLYTLSMCLKTPLDHKLICKSANRITQATYKNVYNHIKKNKALLRKPFYRHGIPFPK